MYIANSMFSEADRRFNAFFRDILKQQGFIAYLPQEDSANRKTNPSNHEIFQQDINMIKEADLLIACLDQETIDPGVACEIGIAVSLSIPVIGLLTDIRQYRTKNKIYKNPFVTGAIEHAGVIVDSIEDVVRYIKLYEGKKKNIAGKQQSHYSQNSDIYKDMVNTIESMYDKNFDPFDVICPQLLKSNKYRIADIGCGPSIIGDQLAKLTNVECYLGFDTSENIIKNQRNVPHELRVHYYAEKKQFLASCRKDKVNFVLLLFMLHDIVNKSEFLIDLSSNFEEGTEFLIIDISTDDLPNLVRETCKFINIAQLKEDTRLSPSLISAIAKDCGLTVEHTNFFNTSIMFNTTNDIKGFIELFAINLGMDFPVINPYLDPYKYSKQLINSIDKLVTPFFDWRSFIICKLIKES